MSRIYFTKVIFISCLIYSPVLIADDSYTFKILSKDSVTILEGLLAAPPKAGSKEAKRDIELVLKAQSNRTESDCSEARAEVKANFENLMGEPNGPLTEKEVKKWSPIMRMVQEDLREIVQRTKAKFNRDRPFLVDDRVHPCVRLEESKAYPSGHSTYAHVYANILSELDSSRKAVFEARADVVAFHRVLGGVHFQSDIDAGELLANQMMTEFMKNESFRKALGK